MKFNKTFVLGAGAIGSIYGALLSQKNDVTIIGNEAHVRVVSSNGLTISGEMERTFHLKAKTEITDVPEETLIILTTKAYDSEDAVERIVKLLRKDTVILVLQNGLGNEMIVKHAVRNRAKVLRGITSMAAEFFNPGKVRFWGGKTIIEQDPAAESIVTMFKASGLDAETRKNLKAELWKKLIANCVINPLTAIFQVRNCEILADSLLNLRHQIVREAVAVGKAQGLAFPADFEKQIDKEITFYSNFSSMCQDIMKKRRTEIDFLNGKIVELGRKSNVPTPVNETLVHFVKFLEEKNELSREDQTEKR